MTDPQTDVEARLRQIRDDIDTLLDGGQAREEDGHSAGALEDIDAVVFALNGRETDFRVTQEPTDPPAPTYIMLAYYIEGMAAATGYEPQRVAAQAIQLMDRLRERDDYGRTASFGAEDPET